MSNQELEMNYTEEMEMIDRQFFGIDMMGFLISAITWSLKAFVIDTELFISSDTFMENWVGSLILFWVCINFLYLLLCAIRLAVQVAEESIFRNAGFVLERFALLTVAFSPEYHEFRFLVIHSVLNICFAWRGYSGGFHRIAEEQQNSSMDLYTGGEWVVFWVDRLALLVSYGVTLLLHSSTYTQGLVMLHLCFSVLFPSLIGYFTWRGYSEAFQSNDVAAEESVKCDQSLEDVQEESMHMKIENATEEESIIENKNSASATSVMEDVTGTVLNQIEDVKGTMSNEIEDKLNKFLVKSEDSWEPFHEGRNDKCCPNVVGKMVRDQEERSLQDLQKEFVDIKDDSLVSKIEDVVGNFLRIQEKRMHMKLVAALDQNRHECTGNN